MKVVELLPSIVEGLDFGVNQFLFDDEINNGNLGYIDSFVMMHEVNDQGEKYYRLTYTPNQVAETEKFTFTVTIKDISNEGDRYNRSMTHILIEKDSIYCWDTKKFDSMEYDEVAGKWLIDSFCGPQRYKYSEVVLKLPPTYRTPYRTDEGMGKGEIKYLEITVDGNEPDVGIVNWWLTRFDNRTEIQCIKIISSATIHINDCLCLRTIPRVEISGLCDLDIYFLYNFEGKCFYWKNMHEANKLSEINVFNACMNCMDHRRWRAIFLDQGSTKTRELTVAYLKDTYANATEQEGTDFYLEHHNEWKFRFHMIENRTVFGNIEKYVHMNRQNARDWP